MMNAEVLSMDLNEVGEAERVQMLAIVEAAANLAAEFLQSERGAAACSEAFFDLAKEVRRGGGELTPAAVAEVAAVTAISVAMEVVRLSGRHILGLGDAVVLNADAVGVKA